MNSFSATTILMVRRDGKTCMASDGQVTFNNTIIKASANKVKRAGKGQVLVGFAGGAGWPECGPGRSNERLDAG